MNNNIWKEIPDVAIDLVEMEEYGYTWSEMFPLTREKALELYDHDIPVYLLYKDDSEALVNDRKQIVEHEGIFGIEKGDWQNELKLRKMFSEQVEESEAQQEVSKHRKWRGR